MRPNKFGGDPAVVAEFFHYRAAEVFLAAAKYEPLLAQARVRQRHALDRLVELTGMDPDWRCPKFPPLNGLEWYQERLTAQVEAHPAGCGCPDCGGRNV